MDASVWILWFVRGRGGSAGEETRDHATDSIIVSEPREQLLCVARKPTPSLAQPKIRISLISPPPDRHRADHPCTARYAATPAATLVMTLSMWLGLLSSESSPAPSLSYVSYTSHIVDHQASSHTKHCCSQYHPISRYMLIASIRLCARRHRNMVATRLVGG